MSDVAVGGWPSVALPSEKSGRLTRRHVGTIVAVGVLLVASLQGWVPRLGHDAAGAGDAGRVASRPSGIDVDRVMEDARHDIRTVDGEPGVLSTGDERYRATFGATGLTFQPAGARRPFELSLGTVTTGAQPVALRTGPWAGSGNVAARDVAPGVLERVTAGNGEIEWDVVLTAPPSRPGNLTVAARLAGTTGTPVRVDGGGGPAWRLGLDGGSSVRLDEMVVVDARGAELYRALPRVTSGAIELTVPAAVLAGANYPVTIDPTVSGPDTVRTRTGAANASVAFSGSTYLVVWDEIVGGDRDVLGRALDVNGVPTGAFISYASTTDSETDPDVAWNGTSFLVTYSRLFSSGVSTVRAQRADVNGRFLGSAIQVSTFDVSTFRGESAVAANGSTWFVVWTDFRNGNADIFGTRISNAGANLDGITVGVRLSLGSQNETRPDVAGNGTSYLVAYQLRYSSTDDDIYARQVDNAATPLGLVPVSTLGTPQRTPAVASDGQIFHVVYGNRFSDTYDVLGVRVSSNGQNLGGYFVTDREDDSQEQPTIAYNGVFLVTWLDRRGPFGTLNVYGGRVQSDGTVMERNGFPIAATSFVEINSVVSRGSGGKWGVVYNVADDREALSGLAVRTLAPK